jgi:hypothetical protein
VRALAIALCLVGCKKHQAEEAPPSAPAEPSRGHSITKFKDGGTLTDPDKAEVAEAPTTGSAAVTEDAAVVDAAPQVGGNGQPAYRDDQGHVHGPGGPVFMGRGAPCDASRNHCMRDGVWFAADNYDSTHLFRALPAFELEGKWWNWRGNEVDSGKLFKTELATPAKLRAGAPVVVWLPETDSAKWAENEYEALTSSRWDVAVVESVSGKTFRIPKWPDSLPIDNARVVVEQKSH